MARKPATVRIVITAPHLYLPLDEQGNGRLAWQDAQETDRVEKRTRLDVPAELAQFLSDRDQAEILAVPVEADAR